MTAAGSPPPALSPHERATAAARAVRARQVRAEARAGLGSGRVNVGDVLIDGRAGGEQGRALARMKVVDLLCSFPGIGPIRAAELMQEIGIAANRRIGGLGERQVARLIEALSTRYPDSGA